jgi:hypothetical protein
MTPTATQTRSFTQWRRVADKLLELETAFSQAKTASSSHSSSALSELEAAVIKMRQTSDGLFAMAMAESARDRLRAEQALPAGTSMPVAGSNKSTPA